MTSNYVHAGQTKDEIRAWLKTFECEMSDKYTHSSLYGSRDWTTKSGRLCFPDNEEIRFQLERSLVTMHNLHSPLCWVEMATPSYPFYEDSDILRGQSDPCADGLLISQQFWLQQAHILFGVFPKLISIELTLFHLV